MHSHVPSNYHFIGTELFGDLRAWFRSSPLFTRFIMGACTILCLCGLFGDLPSYLDNIPSQTIGKFEITRIITAPFTFYTISELFFGFIAYLPICADQEKSSGTLKVLVDFFAKNLQINILFLIFCFIISVVYHSILSIASYGLCGIFVVIITEDCLQNPQTPVSILRTPIQVQAKYYPWIATIIFYIVSNSLRLDLLVCIFTGYFNHIIVNKYYNESLNERKLADLEESSMFSWLTAFPRFVSVRNMSQGLIENLDGEAQGKPEIFASKSYGQIGNGGVEDVSTDKEQQ